MYKNRTHTHTEREGERKAQRYIIVRHHCLHPVPLHNKRSSLSNNSYKMILLGHNQLEGYKDHPQLQRFFQITIEGFSHITHSQGRKRKENV